VSSPKPKVINRTRVGTPYSTRRWKDAPREYAYLSERAFGQAEAITICAAFNHLPIAISAALHPIAIAVEGEVRYVVGSTSALGDFRAKVDLFILGFCAGRALG
jgi:hypothetical protein